jgi:hypothetical protein
MAGKPRGETPLTGKERNRAYRVRKQKEARELRRRLAVRDAALFKIAKEARTLIDARDIAAEALADAG